jgi:DNA polymerase-1
VPATTQKKAPAEAAKGTKKPGELFLIDGNSLAYRAFFALPESIATHDGRPTNAIYGLASMFATSRTSPSESPGPTSSGTSGRI